MRKIECSSIIIKSKERHSSTSRAHRIIFCDCRCRKSRRKPELPTVGSHDSCRKCWLSVTACAVTMDVGSPNVCRNSRQSEVPTCVGSPDSQKSRPKPAVPASMVLLTARCLCTSEVPMFAGSSDRRKSRRSPGVPTLTWPKPGVPASAVLAVWLTVPVGSPDVRRKWWPSEVPTFVRSSDTDLHTRTSDLLWTVFSSYVGSPGICVGTSDVDLNGSIFTWGINTPLLTSNRCPLISLRQTLGQTAPKHTRLPSLHSLTSNFDFQRVWVIGEWIEWEKHLEQAWALDFFVKPVWFAFVTLGDFPLAG